MHTHAWRYPRTTPPGADGTGFRTTSNHYKNHHCSPGEAPRLYPPEADGRHRDWGSETPHRPRSGGAGALGKKLWQNAGLIVGVHYFFIYATLNTKNLTAIPTIIVVP